MDNTLIEKINTTLKSRKNCIVNIINDKLTLAVFSMLDQRGHLNKKLTVSPCGSIPNRKSVVLIKRVLPHVKLEPHLTIIDLFSMAYPNHQDGQNIMLNG